MSVRSDWMAPAVLDSTYQQKRRSLNRGEASAHFTLHAAGALHSPDLRQPMSYSGVSTQLLCVSEEEVEIIINLKVLDDIGSQFG